SPDLILQIWWLSPFTFVQDQRGQVVRRPSPAGYCLPPTAQLPKIERARSRRAAPLFQYVIEPGDFYGQNNLFLSARRHLPVNRSLVAKALNPTLFRRACRMATSRNACSLLDFPEFARAVRYGVLASGKLWEGGRDLNSETFR